MRMLSALLFVLALATSGAAQDKPTPAADAKREKTDQTANSPNPQSLDGVTNRGGLGRAGVYTAKGVPQPTGGRWESPQLFLMKREATRLSTPRDIRMSNGDYWYLPGPTYKYSYGFYFSDPVVAKGTVFFTVYIGDGYLYALDASTGALKWLTKRVKGRFSEPCVAGDFLFVGADGGLFYAVDLNTQQEVWRQQVKDPSFVSASPTVSNGVVYFGRGNGVFYALDALTGKEKWTFASGEASYLVEPAVSNGVIYTGNWKTVFALDAVTGKERWRAEIKNRVSSIAVADDVVYVREVPGNIYSFDAATGEPTPNSQKYGRAATAVTVSDKTLFFGGLMDGDIHAVDAGTGKAKWKFDADGYCNTPAVAQNLVYFTCGDGKLYAADRVTGEKRWEAGKFKPQLSATFLSDGVIYFVSDDGRLHAIK
jgi:outer membrane protein assembly factor BamB